MSSPFGITADSITSPFRLLFRLTVPSPARATCRSRAFRARWLPGNRLARIVAPVRFGIFTVKLSDSRAPFLVALFPDRTDLLLHFAHPPQPPPPRYHPPLRPFHHRPHL